MLQVLENCFPEEMEAWRAKIREMIPSYGLSLAENPELLQEIQANTAQKLGLRETELVYS